MAGNPLRLPAFLFLVCVLGAAAAEEADPDAEAGVPIEEETELASLPPEAFLAEVRRPFRQDAWGEATGSIQSISDKDGELRAAVRIRLTFSPESLHAQLVLNDTNVYAFEQTHGGAAAPATTLDLPETETPPRLFSLGIEPEDLTFAFIYWEFRREHPGEQVLRRECRVMELAHPDGKGTVKVWFSAAHGFPMKAEWYRAGAETPWRSMALKGAKKHAKDLWFVKEMRLEGAGWKTKVRFDHAEINPVEDRAAPLVEP
ncbi:MAG: hypothetical protein JXR77_15195 [Lentisphaeria bacterium]|nr:hypothetical protein [Lentisphaeria bacterium]